MLVNWLHRRGEDWRDRVSEWVSDLGVDAWLIQRDVSEPVDYVRTWMDDAGERGDEATAQAWLDWFDAAGVTAVGSGWVVLRRGGFPHRIAVEEVTQPVDQPLGDEIAGWLDRTHWLRQCTDEQLLGHRFTTAEGVRLDVSSYPSADGWQPVARALRMDRGFRWLLATDESIAGLVSACDGSRPLAAMVTVLAAVTDVGEPDLTAAVCRTVRGLVDRGILVP